MFSVVIPVIPKHFRYISKLLRELASESNLIGEVIICASSVNEETLNELYEIVSESSGLLPTKVIATSEYRSAGDNRNLGWDQSQFEYISFLDADDIYHPRRLSIISKIIREHKVDALVHDYMRLAPRIMFKKYSFPSYVVTGTNALQNANIERMKCVLPINEIYSGQSNLVLPKTVNGRAKIHHGHLVVKKSISVRYSSRKLGEDGELVVEILRNGYKLVHVDAKLSIYDRLNISNVKESLYGHTRVRMSWVYRLLRNAALRK